MQLWPSSRVIPHQLQQYNRSPLHSDLVSVPNDPVYPAVLYKYLNDELKILCLLQFFPEVTQNSQRISWVFHVQRNPWVFQVFQVCGQPDTSMNISTVYSVGCDYSECIKPSNHTNDDKPRPRLVSLLSSVNSPCAMQLRCSKSRYSDLLELGPKSVIYHTSKWNTKLNYNAKQRTNLRSWLMMLERVSAGKSLSFAGSCRRCRVLRRDTLHVGIWHLDNNVHIFTDWRSQWDIHNWSASNTVLLRMPMQIILLLS